MLDTKNEVENIAISDCGATEVLNKIDFNKKGMQSLSKVRYFCSCDMDLFFSSREGVGSRVEVYYILLIRMCRIEIKE
jgi:hypothetical protein